jgi:hypothetical protein
MSNATLLELAPLQLEREEHEHWRTGAVAKRWARQYPNVFDADDLRLALVRCAQGRHYFEWAAARHLHRATGFNALVCKYEFAKHRSKGAIVERLFTPTVTRVLRDRQTHGRAQAPDLLMYAPDLSSFFFCEVKGPSDRIRAEQLRRFDALARVTRQPVHILRIQWAIPR